MTKHIEEYVNAEHKEYIKKISKQAMVIEFDKIFNNQSVSDLNTFIVKPKQAYYSNYELICPYINYFIEFYDDDDELILAYFKMKFMIDRMKKFNKDVFIIALYRYLLSDTMVEKIKKLVTDNYQIKLSPNKNKYKHKAIEFTDEHGLILLEVSMTMKIFIPVVTHYIHVMKFKKTDKKLMEFFEGIFSYFEGDNNMYNKLYEFILSKINKTKNRDRGHWNNVEIFGKDIMSETDVAFSKLMTDIMYKYTFEGNIIALNAKSINNIIGWALKDNFTLNLKPITGQRDEDGLSDLDKIEQILSRFDESVVITSKINCKQTIKKLKKRFNISIDDEEVEYYINYLKINPFQKDLIFQFYGKYFGTIRDMSTIPKKDISKLVIIMKEILRRRGFKIFQHILTGGMRYNPHQKKLPKKIMTKILESEKYKKLQEKYKFTANLVLSDAAFFNNINTILNSTITLIDYKHMDKKDAKLLISEKSNIVIDEYMDFLIENI